MNHRLFRPLLVVLAGSLVLLACHDPGSDPDTKSTTTQQVAVSTKDSKPFCAALDNVANQGKGLSTIHLNSDADIPYAKERMHALLDAMVQALELAPAEIKPQAERFRPYVAELGAALDRVKTVTDLKDQLPKIAEVLGQNLKLSTTDGGDVVDYAARHCPGLTAQ